jgi:ribonuclease HII
MTPKFDMSLIPPDPDLSFESTLWQSGLMRVAGMDEAGRGPIAGPVTAAAIILPPDPVLAVKLRGVRDSKQMTAADREFWADCLKTTAWDWGIGSASSYEIDQMGIIPATRLAAIRSLLALKIAPEHLLIDYLRIPECDFPQTPLVKGDARCLSIAAASVLAKVSRDAHLCELDELYPGYNFAANKGYCTPEHITALQVLGPCPIHRQTFRPIRVEDPAEEPEEDIDE